LTTLGFTSSDFEPLFEACSEVDEHPAKSIIADIPIVNSLDLTVFIMYLLIFDIENHSQLQYSFQ
jgi:hypothetical protein